jgi:hypothetical protein
MVHGRESSMLMIFQLCPTRPLIVFYFLRFD